MQIGAVCASLALVIGSAAYLSAEEIPITTPVHATLDVSPFRRVLVASFVSGGNADVGANVETVRLLQSQLRSKTSLTVIDADVDIRARLLDSESSEGNV